MALITSGISILETTSKLLSGIFLFGVWFIRGAIRFATADIETQEGTVPQAQGVHPADGFHALHRRRRGRVPGRIGGRERRQYHWRRRLDSMSFRLDRKS